MTSEEKLRFYLDDVRDAYLSYEGAEAAKRTYITEFGWSTAHVSPDVQATNLLIAFDTFRQVGYVARAYWFHAQDVPEADLYYGLAEESGRKKRAFTVYQDAAAYDAPLDEAGEPAPAPGAQVPRAGNGSERRVPPAFRPRPDSAPPRTTDGGRP